MTDNTRRDAAKPRNQPRGRPFKKGFDPNRNMAGQKNKKAVNQTRRFAEILRTLCDEKTKSLDKRTGQTFNYTNLEWIARRLIARAIEGDARAIEEVVRQIEAREGGAGGQGVTITITPAGKFKVGGNGGGNGGSEDKGNGGGA